MHDMETLPDNKCKIVAKKVKRQSTQHGLAGMHLQMEYTKNMSVYGYIQYIRD